MGSWGFHPMGNDDALNAQTVFLKDVEFTGNIDDYKILVKEYLKKLTLNDINKIKPLLNIDNETNIDYLYVIPYTFIEYEVFKISVELKN